MISYELAKRLKDAGFPKRMVVCCRLINDNKHEPCKADRNDCKLEVLNFPTLSELIEACGDRFDQLLGPYHNAEHVRTGYWRADGFLKKKDWELSNEPYISQAVLAGSPDEAVALLWLALKENIKVYQQGGSSIEFHTGPQVSW